MHGPKILVDTLSVPTATDQHGNQWQYHSRGDRHSKVACWGILLDLLEACPTLVEQFAAGSVAFGINHEMNDYQQNRKKRLDLVVCTPASGVRKVNTLESLAEKYAVSLPKSARQFLKGLPAIQEAPVGAVRVALEAKAAMTAHVKALPRLHDELNSSHLTIHGASEEALAVGFVMVNISDWFISPDKNKHRLSGTPAIRSAHKQPGDAQRVVQKIGELPRTSSKGGNGFDAVGIVVVDCRNDGVSPIKLHEGSPAPKPGDIFHYDKMIYRLAELYRNRFA